MPQCIIYITGKALPSREKQSFNFFHLELKVFFIAFYAYSFRVSTRCPKADERELRAFDDTLSSPRALLQNGEFRVVPSSGETLWLQVPFPGRRIRSTTIWDFCDGGTISSDLCLYSYLWYRINSTQDLVKESQVWVLGCPSCNYVNLGVNFWKSQSFHQLCECYLPRWVVVLIKWSNTSTCAF